MLIEVKFAFIAMSVRVFVSVWIVLCNSLKKIKNSSTNYKKYIKTFNYINSTYATPTAGRKRLLLAGTVCASPWAVWREVVPHVRGLRGVWIIFEHGGSVGGAVAALSLFGLGFMISGSIQVSNWFD